MKPINRNFRFRLQFFSRNIWFLIPISKGGKTRFVDAHAIIDFLYQVPQTTPAHLMKRRNIFD